jgi:hypothetical protein
VARAARPSIPRCAGSGAQQLRKHLGRAAFRVEEERHARLVAAETISVKLADLPDGVSVERGRIEVRFDAGGVVASSGGDFVAAGEASTRAPGDSASRLSRRSTSPPTSGHTQWSKPSQPLRP